MRVNRIVVALLVLLLLVFLYYLLIAGREPMKDTGGLTEVPVDCNDPDQSLAAAVKQHRRIRVVGKCEEDKTVLITRDDIIIDGRGTGIIDGKGSARPVIKIRGAKNVIIRGLTVRNGQYGILAVGGATVGLADINAVSNSISGISLVGQPCSPKPRRQRMEEQSSTKTGWRLDLIRDASAATNCYRITQPTGSQPGSGMVFNLQNALLCGTINANDNEISGIHVRNNSEVEFSGATVNTLENSGVGFVQDNGIIVERPPSIVLINTASAINAMRNVSHGIIAIDDGLIVIEDASSTITSSDNDGVGLFIGSHANDQAGVDCDDAATTLTLTNNVQGAVGGVPANPQANIVGCQVSP